MLCVCQTVQLVAGVRSNTQLGMQLRAALGQAFQQQRVELPALPVQDHLHRGVVVERFFVAALACQASYTSAIDTTCAAMGICSPLSPSG